MKWKLTLWLLLLALPALAQPYTRQDTLRGSNGRGRDWWDVMQYRLNISLDTASKSIFGFNEMMYKIVATPTDSMQIDLQEGMTLDSVFIPNWDAAKPVKFKQEGNVYWLDFKGWFQDKRYWHTLFLYYHGSPRIAVNPPWDGGFIWTKDSMGKPWIAVACQGLGASSWWPCKDYQGDEPDSGMRINIALNSWDYSISNGKLFSVQDVGQYTSLPDGSKRLNDRNTSFYWQVHNPINTYSTTFYIGDYAHYHDTLHGEKGVLDLDFYPLKYNEAKARKHWAITKEMLRCFEYWMGPYPFYEDGYKLVEAPYLGMEHQSAVAYGNEYKMGYLGSDRSGTGIGLAFDFIIVHESGHEWFGNSITAQDIADNWLHEGFTTYTEALFAEWIRGRKAGFAYTTGEWKNIRNDRPVIGDYGVNKEGSGDMYDKGSAVVHMIRMMLHDDDKFRLLLRGLNHDFYHRIVTSKEVEAYIGKFADMDLAPFFDQYLRSKAIPELVIIKEKKTHGRARYSLAWRNCNKDFRLKIESLAGKTISVGYGPMSGQLTRKQLRSLAKAAKNYLIIYDPESVVDPAR